MKLFAEKGFGSTSIADILRAAGVNSGSLYYFFPTKQDLLIEVLRSYERGIGAMLLAPAWEGVDDPLKQVFALLAAYRGLLSTSDCAYGCPIGSLALELHEPDPPVRDLLGANFNAWVEAVERCYRAAGNRLPAEADRHGLAVLTLTTMEGGVMLARTMRNLGPYDTAVDALRNHIELLEREAAGRSKSNEDSAGNTGSRHGG